MQKKFSQEQDKRITQVERAASSERNTLIDGASIADSDSDLPITVYTPESPLSRPLKLLHEMVQDLINSRELAWRLFVRDTRARYRNSLLGYLWVFIPPLLASIPFIFLNAQGVIKIDETPLPYGAFALIGTMVWQVFVDSLHSPLNAVSGARHMLTRIKFPREAILISALLQTGFNFLVRLLLIVIVFVWYGITPPITIALFPFGIFALVLAGFAIGLLFTPLGLLYGDVQRIVFMATPFVMLLTPVLYPIPDSGLAATLAALNPLTPLVTNTRDWLASGVTPDLVGFIVVTAVMAVLVLVGWVSYRVSLPHLIVRLGT